jgi:hypothetical protein
MLLGFGGLLISAFLARGGREPFASGFVALAAWSYLLLVDGWVYRHRGESLIQSHPRRFLFLAVWSLVFKLFNEMANLRLGYWAHGVTPASRGAAWILGAALLAAAVPVLLETADLIESAGVFKSVTVPPLHRAPSVFVVTGGLIFAVLALGWPRLFSPLWWAVPLFLCDPLNERLAEPSLLSDARVGQVRKIALVGLAGLLTGVLWEVANVVAGPHWIYPTLDNPVRFLELPVAGYLLYPFMALSAYASSVTAVALWDRSRPWVRILLAFAAAVGVVAALARVWP